MKAVILAGGFGTRISEESGIRPKPMVEVGGRPILWHIMKMYSAHGINDFIICCGYKGYIIKEYFANYCMNNSDVTFDMHKGSMEIHRNQTEDWRVTLVNTGYHSMTGGRMLRVREYIGNETFCMTYGDGVSDIDITSSIQFHRQSKTLATLAAVQQPGRFGVFNLAPDDTIIKS
ncbi:MAG: sugar phosphate nucleotidyltransferase, partial [Bacteroidota bacterium]|nr:sugar phosphate nucleotidyltransferase [Bacteroidota bacterium]